MTFYSKYCATCPYVMCYRFDKSTCVQFARATSERHVWHDILVALKDEGKVVPPFAATSDFTSDQLENLVVNAVKLDYHWQTASPRQTSLQFSLCDFPVDAVHVVPGGCWAITLSRDHGLHCWDLSRPSPHPQLIDGTQPSRRNLHTAAITAHSSDTHVTVAIAQSYFALNEHTDGLKETQIHIWSFHHRDPPTSAAHLGSFRVTGHIAYSPCLSGDVLSLHFRREGRIVVVNWRELISDRSTFSFHTFDIPYAKTLDITLLSPSMFLCMAKARLAIYDLSSFPTTSTSLAQALSSPSPLQDHWIFEFPDVCGIRVIRHQMRSDNPPIDLCATVIADCGLFRIAKLRDGFVFQVTAVECNLPLVDMAQFCAGRRLACRPIMRRNSIWEVHCYVLPQPDIATPVTPVDDGDDDPNTLSIVHFKGSPCLGSPSYRFGAPGYQIEESSVSLIVPMRYDAKNDLTRVQFDESSGRIFGIWSDWEPNHPLLACTVSFDEESHP
ncbi:hypothetical protein FRB99_007043 [Tulasnella sp. 403]|nr:hypothetical protein FRB99_007043 [Tulasnella sp. 403]